MTLRAHNIVGPAILALVCAFYLFPGPANAAPGQCAARIAIVLDPEVANPRAPSFLTALVSSPLYSLTWIEGDDTRAVYDLSGPGTDTGCADGIDRIRRSSAVLDLQILP